MPLCIYCKAQTVNFVVLPELRSSSIEHWLTTYDLDASKLSAEENVMCSSHVRDLRADLSLRSDPPEVNMPNFVAFGDSSQVSDPRLQRILSSMENISIKDEAASESGLARASDQVSTVGDSARFGSRAGPSGSRQLGNALSSPPATPTQVCDVTSTTPSSEAEVLECPVCLQPPQLPIKLPCNHIFCFLCAKGFANQLGRCAYCRAEIPVGYMQLPTVVPRNSEENPSPGSKYYWFYAGRDGWWQFEERHCQELEDALERGDSQYDVQISGFIYVIDFVRMVQYRKDRPGRTRQIKRDIISAPRKGVAGLREDLINGSLI